MLLDELKIPFRWLLDPENSTRLKTDCTGYRYKLITPFDRLLPFIARFPTPAGGAFTFPVEWKIYNSDTDAVTETLPAEMYSMLDYYRSGAWDYIVYKGQPLEIELPTGYYYSRIKLSDDRILESEEFWIDCDEPGTEVLGDFNSDFNEDFGPAEQLYSLPKYIKLIWWHDCDIDNLFYQTGYQNHLYFSGPLQKGEPRIVLEGSEDGAKKFIPTFALYVDSIHIVDYVPEHVLSSLLPVAIHKKVFVVTNGNQFIGRIDNFSVSFAWENSCHARVDITFEMSRLIAENCCQNNVLQPGYFCPATITEIAGGDEPDNDGVFHLSWEVETGAPDGFEWMNLFTGVWTDIAAATTLDVNQAGVGQQIRVRPYCTHANGRRMYGTERSVSLAPNPFG